MNSTELNTAQLAPFCPSLFQRLKSCFAVQRLSRPKSREMGSDKRALVFMESLWRIIG